MAMLVITRGYLLCKSVGASVSIRLGGAGYSTQAGPVQPEVIAGYWRLLRRIGMTIPMTDPCMVYMVTFTINIPPMIAYILYTIHGSYGIWLGSLWQRSIVHCVQAIGPLIARKRVNYSDPHCDLTGTMVSKGNLPNSRKFQGSELLKVTQIHGEENKFTAVMKQQLTH